MGCLRILALAALIACGSSPRPVVLGARVPKGCAEGESKVLSENCVGWWLDRVLGALAFRGYEDRAIERYVNSVGRRLARAAGDHRPWKFVVLDDPGVQAFVTLGSIVYIYRGTLATLRSEAELAAVLAHEMGHLRGGHARERFDELGRDVLRSQAEQSLQTRYARDDEIQADEHAVLLTARAGYDSRAVVTMLQALAGTTDDDEEDPDDVHPWWPERIARAQALIARAAGGELGVERYRTHVASLIVGDDPRVIALVGNAAVFARAGVAIDLPPHQDVVLDDGRIEITYKDGATAGLRPINIELAKLFAGDQTSKEAATETYVSGREAISLAVVRAPDAAIRARALKAAIRKPRADELARIVPVRVDLEAPRRLWSR